MAEPAGRPPDRPAARQSEAPGRSAGPGAAARGPRGKLSALGEWLDGRTGYRAIVRKALDEPVAGGPSWAYVFGSTLTFVLVTQLLTGVLLAAFYAPSATTAWASVAYIQDQVWLGWFIRGLHSAGASMMVVVLLLHFLQVVVYGAYRSPREVNWFTGLVLALLVMGFALTGYLLPWDQKGYWATQVATTLLGALPLLGPSLQTLLQGGPVYGNLTLTHFYALHVFVLPGVCLLFVVAHVALFRRHGVTPRWGQTPGELHRRTEPFWPRQLTYDLLAMAVLLAFMMAWVVKTHGADLAAPADPSSAYEARPEWYFLPLYQLLKYFPGPLEIVAAFGMPLLAMGVLAGLPFLDRAAEVPSTDPRLRRGPIALVGLGMVFAVVLGGTAQVEDNNPTFHKNQQAAREQAERARRLALSGVLPAGGVAVYLNDPLEQGRALFVEHCAGCHRLGIMGPADDKDERGPDLSRWASRAWLDGFLKDPDGKRFFGKTQIHGMDPVDAGDDERRALVEYIYGLGGPSSRVPDQRPDAKLVQAGRQLFKDKSCDSCHEVDGKTEGEGPNLKGHASQGWVRGFLSAPAGPLYFGAKNDMPAFGKKLSAEELDRLSAFIAAER